MIKKDFFRYTFNKSKALTKLKMLMFTYHKLKMQTADIFALCLKILRLYKFYLKFSIKSIKKIYDYYPDFFIKQTTMCTKLSNDI